MLASSAPHYSTAQVASLLAQVPTLDLGLIDDGTYFVAERHGRLVACGGWSARKPGYDGSLRLGGDDEVPTVLVRAMYTDPDHARQGHARRILRAAEDEMRAAGYREAALDALLGGVALYRACGWRDGALAVARLRDGTRLPVLRMTKRLASCDVPMGGPLT